jgi:hypothetical protein
MAKTMARPTLESLRARRDEIVRLADELGATNVRIVGSVAHGEADDASDVDVLVDVVADARGLAYFGVIEDLRRGLSSLLGRPVDVVDAAALRTMREPILREAVPL